MGITGAVIGSVTASMYPGLVEMNHASSRAHEFQILVQARAMPNRTRRAVAAAVIMVAAVAVIAVVTSQQPAEPNEMIALNKKVGAKVTKDLVGLRDQVRSVVVKKAAVDPKKVPDEDCVAKVTAPKYYLGGISNNGPSQKGSKSSGSSAASKPAAKGPAKAVAKKVAASKAPAKGSKVVAKAGKTAKAATKVGKSPAKA